MSSVSPDVLRPQTPSSSSLSFTQGFVLGQLSIALLLFFFIKFFIFGDPPSSDDRASALFSARRAHTLSRSQRSPPTSPPFSPQNSIRTKHSTVLRNPPPLTTATILAKTYYNVNGHQPESLDWFNVLVAQALAQLRADALADSAILTSLTSVLNGPSKPDFLSDIKITEISLGEEFPIFSNCRIIPVSDSTSSVGIGPASGRARADGVDGSNTRLQARMDVDLSDFITLGIETSLVLNYPKPFSAVLPIALAVSVVRFSGTLSLSFVPTPNLNNPSNPIDRNHTDPPKGNTTLTFSFLDDYRLDLSVKSLIGSRSRLQDIPKIAQLVEARLHEWFDERCVEPRFQQIVLPSFWPRKRTARGGEEEGDVEDQQDARRQGQQHDSGLSAHTSKDGYIGQRDKPLPRTPPPLNRAAADSEDATRTREQMRLGAEADKIRQAEHKAERAKRQILERNASSASDGIRWRRPGPAAEAATTRGGLRMPGGMPGMMVS